MTNIYLNTTRLAALVRNKRGNKGLREISETIGNVSPSTLSRVENGSIPDMETFVALCNWLDVRPGDLFISDQQERELDTEEELVLLLLGDARLEPDTAYALSQIIKATYRYLLD
ncbi:helix-turn-helix domain-containing protein [Nostoc sp.]|uniref:helix-turn-helix domain-containing protein n=1 Tax=Nostoc sp. TaxID=1180 RepID=UPI002FFC9D49